jgi:hypothetical protein
MMMMIIIIIIRIIIITIIIIESIDPFIGTQVVYKFFSLLSVSC